MMNYFNKKKEFKENLKGYNLEKLENQELQVNHDLALTNINQSLPSCESQL